MDHLSASNKDTHFEYHPIVNARAHQIGTKTKRILNRNFRRTYDRFLISIVQKGGLQSTDDKLRMVYYLQLQDRIEDAISLFQQIEPVEEGSSLKVQYDYLDAYIDFFTGQE